MNMKLHWRSAKARERQSYAAAAKKAAAQIAPRRQLGHRPSGGLYLIVALLVLCLLASAVVSLKAVQRLQDDQARLRTEIAYLESERDRYKAAYESAVQDAQAFSRMYDITYGADVEGDAEEEWLAANETGTGAAIALPKESVWGYYAARGVVSDACIPTTKGVATSGDDVEIVLVARGTAKDEKPKVSLLVDGTPVASYAVEATDMPYRATVTMPAGKHHVDVVYRNPERSGSVTFSLVRIGDRSIQGEMSLLDSGMGFGLFDCRETSTGNTLRASGALRFTIEKLVDA